MTPEFEWTLDHCYFSATSLNHFLFFILILVKVLIILMYGFFNIIYIYTIINGIINGLYHLYFLFNIFLYMKLN